MMKSNARPGKPAPAGVARRRIVLAASAAACAQMIPSVASAKGDGAEGDILLGQSCQLTGPLAALTTEVRLGAKLHFDEVNKNGGINGRQVRVIALDDAYDPKRTAANTVKLIDEENVLALFQFAGTPGSLAAMPIAEEKKVALFAPFTGSDALRTKQRRYVFNIKAGYGDELEAMVRQIASMGISKAAVVYLNNAFGTGGLAQVEKLAAAHNVQLLAKAALEVDGAKLDATVAAAAQNKPPAIILVSAGKPSVDFVDAYLKAGHRSMFYMLSVTSNTQLVQVLGERARGIIISQVVPSPWNQSVKLVREFQKLARAAGVADFTFSQMEGFVSANAMSDVLRRAGRAPTRDGVVRALEETRHLELGGYVIELSPTQHSSGKLVDLLILDRDGRFRG